VRSPQGKKQPTSKTQEDEVGNLLDLLLLITKDVHPTEKGPREMLIVIQRPYSHLREELVTTFKGQSEVNVIVDRRRGDRRVKAEPFQIEQRRADRRSLKEKMVEVLIRL
jgi:hypothetical protein